MHRRLIGKQAILVPLLLGLSCAACGNPAVKEAKEESGAAVTETAEESVKDSAAETAENADSAENWRALYEQEFDRLSGYGELERKGYYDISGDGVPELFLGSRFGAECQIFTIKDGEVQYVSFFGKPDFNADLGEKPSISFCDGQAVLEWRYDSEGGRCFAAMDAEGNVVIGSFDIAEEELFRLNGEDVDKETFLVKFPAAETLLAADAAEREIKAQEGNIVDSASDAQDNQADASGDTSDWRALYEQEIAEISGYEELVYQAYYDISGDGIPEMLVSADGMDIDVFTIADGKVQYVTYLGVTLSDDLSENDGCVNALYLCDGIAVLESDGAAGTGWSFAVMDGNKNVTFGRFCTFFPEKLWLNGAYVEKEVFLESFPIAQKLLEDPEGDAFFESIDGYRAEKSTGAAENSAEAWGTDGFSLDGENQADASKSTADWITIYEQELERLTGYSEPYSKWYYDISGDGVPELFLRLWWDRGIRVFTMDNGNVRCAAYLELSDTDAVYFEDGAISR